MFERLLVNSIFSSCTELEESLKNEPVKIETLATEGEDGRDPDEDDNDQTEKKNGGI
ncbi:hypothetical protein [Polaribacter sp. IC073]|uniref:hypothetical protein n=1 Tax=Polaribacter sp. IC073 TaxID=2508540 RepID=UPI00167AA76B|nr:hypothetical protein [Polaribacter sp. IC073]